MGIVHHSNYLAYFEEARVAYLRARGPPVHRSGATTGWSRRCSSRSSASAQPLRFDDLVDIRLRLAAVTRTTFQMAYLVTVDDDGRTRRRRAPPA